MTPFRWSIKKREQLGSLIDTDKPIGLIKNGLLQDIRETSARILAFADDADFAFIGRTPENFFDYFSGLFEDMEDAPRLHLVQFSLRYAGDKGVRSIPPSKLQSFFDYLKEEKVDAKTIAENPRPIALVDFVAYGGTMQNFIELLQLQAEQDGVDWNAVQRRLKIIGLRARTHNSPNTWRWQQHQDWLHLIPDTVIKNVSAPGRLLYDIANWQPKVTHSFHPGKWDKDEGQKGYVTEDRRRALELAVRLYDKGRSRDERTQLAALIAKSPEMKQQATRQLVLRLKNG